MLATCKAPLSFSFHGLCALLVSLILHLFGIPVCLFISLPLPLLGIFVCLPVSVPLQFSCNYTISLFSGLLSRSDKKLFTLTELYHNHPFIFQKITAITL